MDFRVVQCEDTSCALRFPVTALDKPPRRCPRCGGSLRTLYQAATAGDEHAPAQRNTLPLRVLVDNVRSAFNVGSILRSADAAGAHEVILCGITPTPEHPRVARSALGAESSVRWSWAADALAAAAVQREAGSTLWALEEGEGARSLHDVALPAHGLTLVVGNEVVGVEPALLALCECVVALPMRGTKRSLNVAVACGAALVLLGERMDKGSG